MPNNCPKLSGMACAMSWPLIYCQRESNFFNAFPGSSDPAGLCNFEMSHLSCCPFLISSIQVGGGSRLVDLDGTIGHSDLSELIKAIKSIVAYKKQWDQFKLLHNCQICARNIDLHNTVV